MRYFSSKRAHLVLLISRTPHKYCVSIYNYNPKLLHTLKIRCVFNTENVFKEVRVMILYLTAKRQRVTVRIRIIMGKGKLIFVNSNGNNSKVSYITHRNHFYKNNKINWNSLQAINFLVSMIIQTSWLLYVYYKSLFNL